MLSFYVMLKYVKYFSIIPLQVVLSDVVGSMLAIGPKVYGLKAGWGRWIFKGNKNLQHPSFRGAIKPLAPCCKILQHVKEPLEVWTKILHKAKLIIFFASSSCCANRWLLVQLPESSVGQISFSLSISFHHGSACSYITRGMNSRLVGGCSSEM
jgi:hypothetical protein